MEEENKWLTSKETKDLAKIKDCDLMHYRLSGKLKFKKKGNAFLYEKVDVLKINTIGN